MIYWGIQVLPKGGEKVQSIVRSVCILILFCGGEEKVFWDM